MANPFPAAAAAAAAAAHQFATNGDALAGVKAEAGGPAAPSQPSLVKSEGPPPTAPLPPANFSPQPPQQSHVPNSLENQNNNTSVSSFEIIPFLDLQKLIIINQVNNQRYID